MSAAPDVARKLWDEELSDSMPSFRTQLSAFNITINGSIFDNLPNTKLAGDWKVPPSFTVRPYFTRTS